jgi:hypothetical protein
MGWRRRTYFDQWPGRGPFSYLPPWQRPGRSFGFGRSRQTCARFPWLPRGWWADPTYVYQPTILTPTLQDEIAALEESKKGLSEDKASIEQEIYDTEKQLKELRSKLETDKKQQLAGQ